MPSVAGMRRRPAPDPVSPRALARLRDRRRGWVPSPEGLGLTAPAAVPGPDPDPDTGRHRRVEVTRGWVRLPSALAGASWQPGRPAVLGVVVVTVLAVLVLGLRVAWARADGGVLAPGARDGPVGVSAGAVPVGVPAPAGSPGAAPSGAGSSDPGAGGVVVVHVVGQVTRPGVQRLPAGSRVSDALAAAGGATRGADLAAINLARLLVDGEQVVVPRPGEALPSAGAGAAPGVGGAPAPGGRLSLNTADVAALDTLPGIGPVIAQRIVDWREQHGRFTSVDELAEVSGIGEKLLAQVRPLVTT